MSSGHSGYLPARAPSLPNHLPEPIASYLNRPQETDAPPPVVHNPSGFAAAGPRLDSSPPPATAASPNLAADRQISPSSNASLPHTRSQPIHAVASSGPDAYSPSPPSSVADPQNRPTAIVPAQREEQSASVRPAQSHSAARVRLPAPGSSSRQRLLPNEQRFPMTLGQHARRDVADYQEVIDYEAAHATASQTSDDDSDRDFGPNPYASAGHAYLRNARQSQILRGQMNNKRVASKKAIQSLQKVDVDSLPDTEKTCVICYNDFAVASPEGTVEMPLRLPKCKHVFGNQCILKWLEESNSCPYCRDKLESEMARPDQDAIRRLLIESELGHIPPSIRHRLYRTQATDRAEWRARQREFENNRDSISRGERRAAPLEDSSDPQRRQRPRFSVDGLNSANAPASQHPSAAQRTPAWQQGPAVGNLWAMAPQYGSAAPAPAVHSPSYTLPSFPMANTGFSHDLNGPSFPPMFSREDFYSGPQHAELAQMGFDVRRPGAAHEYPLPRPLYPFARHTHSPGDPFHYTTHQQNSQQQSPYSNMAQPVRQDGPPQGGASSSPPNRN
ncbi:hypothetical protein N0V93_001008 [Gnomoniopsis smithogilvyi]|uniref:RING-type domain-containing protein n=1 Tax=Gnomoniopsis smithogilvyi TaxID=1191159 RepID=A0A9W9D2B7_9PEZI|nr:hypothetical protein N0V93_001008 [Gnomoniopsis smithogilvyi]